MSESETGRTELEPLIADMMAVRDKVKGNKEILDAAMRKWENENTILLQYEKQAKAVLAEIEARVRVQALECFHIHGEKAMFGGVGIRESTVLSYDDARALEWAIEHKVFLRLDVKGFEAHAKKNRIEWVTEHKSVQATLPR